MSINLNKVKVNLTASQKAKIPSVAGNLIESFKAFTDTAPKTAEGEIAFTDEDTSARYIRLQRKGLNMLRSEIIAITEFIPVASESNSNLNTLPGQYVLGNESQASITNVARLIELHRQIREYIISAAEAVLKKIYPDTYNDEFLKELKSLIDSNFDDLIDHDIVEIIKNITTLVREQATGDFAKTLITNESNPFLLATIEYFVYENLINTIATYLGRVAQIDEKAARNWSIEKFSNLKNYSPESAFSGVLKNLYNNASTTSLNDGEDISKNVLALHRDASNSDTDMLVNAQSHLVSLISLKDSASVLSTVKNTDVTNLDINPGEVRYGITGDLAKSLKGLKNIKFKDMAAALPSGTGLDKLAVGIRNYNANLNMSKLRNVFSLIETASGEKIDDTTEGINEVLAALSYDFITFAVIKNGVTAELSELKGNITGDNSNVLMEYLKSALGATSSDQSLESGAVKSARSTIPGKDSVNKRYFGNFSLPLAGLRQNNAQNQFGQIDRDTFYAPLESTKKEIGSNGQGYIPAAQYFIEHAIERSGVSANDNVDVDFEELNTFTNLYKTHANHLHLDIMTLLPDTNNSISSIGLKSSKSKGAFLGNDNNTLSYLKNLNKKLANDIQNIISKGRDPETSIIPMLALFITDGSDSRMIKNFMSIFWSSIIKGCASTDQGKQDVFLQPSTGDGTLTASGRESIRKSIASMIEYYNESAVHSFLNDTCNFDLRNRGVGKKKFNKSNEKYTVVMAENGNVVKSNGKGTKNKIPSDKPLNSDALDIPRTNSSRFVIEPGQIDNVFDMCFGNGVRHKEINKSNIPEATLEDGFGFARIFNNSLTAVQRGKDSKINAALGSNSDLIEDSLVLFQKNLDTSIDTDVILTSSFGSLGGICQLKLHHRSLVWIYYVYNLLRKTIQIHIKAGENGNLEFKIDFDQLRGLSDALLGNERPTKTGSYQYAYDAASTVIDSLYDKVEIRQSKIRDTIAMFSLHADALKEVKNNALAVITGNSGQDTKTVLAINTMKEAGVFNDALSLNNDMSPSLILASFQKNYMTSNNSLLPKDVRFNTNKTKFMLRYMSEPGYGFLTNEKRGNKSVLHIGIPNSMISALQINAFEETDDARYLNSPYVCISVFKHSHIYPDHNFHPKNYIFDTSANILDYNVTTGNEANHLLNFKLDATFDQLIQSVEVTRHRVDVSGNVNSRISKGYGTLDSEGVYRKDVLINHITDYVLKEYNKLTTGLNFDEESFLLIDSPIDFNKINSTSLLGPRLNNEYLSVLEMISKSYPEMEQDNQLKSEIFRMTKIIKQVAPFSFINRFKKVITPKSFDKVYSIIVNEKDFILDTEERVFDQPVKFFVNSQIQRPQNLKSSYIRDAGSLINTNQISNYAKSISENYPEIHNYSVTLSLLPETFEPGATLKPPLKEAKSISVINASAISIDAPSSPGFGFTIT